MTDTTELKALLWAAWVELNAIRARDGAPQHITWYRGQPTQNDSVSHEYFSRLVDAMSDALGDECQPWPSEAMKPHLKALSPDNDA